MGLLDRQIKRAVAKGFKGKLLQGTLSRRIALSTNELGDPVGNPSTFKIQGFPEDFSDFHRRTAGIPDTDLKIVLIAGLMATKPVQDDKVGFYQGEFAGKWFQLRTVEVDPAGAHYECRAFECGAP